MANLSQPLTFTSTPLTRQGRVMKAQSYPLTRKARATVISSPFPHDITVVVPSKTVSGTIYTLGGVIAPGATVKLFRQSDDFLCKVGVTDGSGHYLFVRDQDDTNAYYVLAYTSATSPQVHGVSDRGIVPT